MHFHKMWSALQTFTYSEDNIAKRRTSFIKINKESKLVKIVDSLLVFFKFSFSYLELYLFVSVVRIWYLWILMKIDRCQILVFVWIYIQGHSDLLGLINKHSSYFDQSENFMGLQTSSNDWHVRLPTVP